MPEPGESMRSVPKRRLPYTKRERQRWAQSGLGYRPVSGWGSGDLPAPWAEGDIVERVNDLADERLDGMTGLLTIVYATSIGEGDEWYFRVTDGSRDPGYRTASGRLHVGYVGRRTRGWGDQGDVDFMAAFRLVDTADPDGLALRERMLADGWKPPVIGTCPHCGHTVYEEDPDA